jgi:hypothetical protein
MILLFAKRLFTQILKVLNFVANHITAMTKQNSGPLQIRQILIQMC